jgi:GT2 family glycosyltransferase
VTVSVLICTYNRSTLLAQCLDALVERTTVKPDQIVVVNGGDARADAVVEKVRSGAKAFEVQVCLVKTVNKNLAASRNVGLPHCTGDIVAMTDDDAEVFPDWVAQLGRAHAEHPEAGAVGGMVIGAETTSLVSRVADRVTFPTFPAPGYVRTLPGVNVSYKRAAVQRVGPQDETLFRGEDVDYNWRIQQFGYKVYYDPAVKVLHHHRSTVRSFLSQQYMYGRAYFLVRRKWHEMYCVYPHALARPRDFLKAINFVAAAWYEPLRTARRMERPGDALAAYPLALAQQFAWRGGMIRQRFASIG